MSFRAAVNGRTITLAPASGEALPPPRHDPRPLGFDVDAPRDTQVIVDCFVERVSDLSLKPGCMELLAAARGKVPLALASSSSWRLITAVLDRFALAPMLDVIVSGESVPHPKPAPDIFLRAAAELGVSPDRCAVLEDSLAGVRAGRAAGMTVIAIPEGSQEAHGFELVADVVLPDLHAALAWLSFAAPESRPAPDKRKL